MAPSQIALEETALLNANPHLSIKLEASTFLANDHPILTHVPPNITTHDSSTVGCFVGFDADESRSRHVASIGKLRGIRFTSIFRFKLWWSTHWSGANGGDVEHETQMMILENDADKGRPYVDVCMESGSARVTESRFRSALYAHVHDDPFGLLDEAAKAIRVHLGTFRLMEEKAPPGIVDKFGWCTWDAFCLKVHPEGVRGLAEGGCPPELELRCAGGADAE